MSIEDPHGVGSHVPVLRMALALMRPRRILELGSGLFSTPTFLEAPSVENVVSLETEEKWIEILDKEVPDERLDLYFVEDVVASMPTPSDFDLVFIDNGHSISERVEAQRAVLAGPHPPTIVHDYEVAEYAAVVEEHAAPNFIVHNADLHKTAICWQEPPPRRTNEDSGYWELGSARDTPGPRAS